VKILKQVTLVLLILTAFTASSQTIQLNGVILDSIDSKPVSNAIVYIASSTISTKTSESGTFSFSKLLPGNYQLIISRLGYHTKQIEVTVRDKSLILNIFLASKQTMLDEVAVHVDNDRKKNLALFEKEFLGSSGDQQCVITNQDVLDLRYDSKNKILLVKAERFLEISNSYLGYKIHFWLKEFRADYYSNTCHYSGVAMFEEMKGTKRDQQRWIKNRKLSYDGSFRHFLVSASQGNSVNEKFVIRKLVRTTNTERLSDSLIKAKLSFFQGIQRKDGLDKALADSINYWAHQAVTPRSVEYLGDKQIEDKNIISIGIQPNTFDLNLSDALYVIYKKEIPEDDLVEDLHRFPEAKNFQISAISKKGLKEPVTFNSDGILLNNERLFYEGVWNNKIVEMLPFDYVVK
jgi:hypothetical protein